MPRSLEHRTVWIGAAGSMPAWGVAQSLRERWPRTRVVAADTNPRHLIALAADADHFVRVPPARDAAFLGVLADAAARLGVDTYVPIHDVEVVVAAEAVEAGTLPPGLRTTAPPAAAARICSDKLIAAETLTAADVPVPRTSPAGEDGWSGPCMVKPRSGVGSRGARLLGDPSQRTEEECGEAYVLQEPCTGPEVTIDAFRSRRDGWFAATCRERVEVRTGITTRCRIFADDELAAIAEATAVALDLTGSFCLQTMWAPGGWRVTDVNPRPGGATRMSVAAGMDYHAAMLADVWDADPRSYLPGIDGERWVSRAYVERVQLAEPSA